MKDKLKVIALGGFGEIGKNMIVFQYRESILVVDAGLMFPDGDMLGIDFVIPDVSYLISHKNNIKGIVLTHGHEDHIGALPYILRDLDVPIYGTPLTLGLVERKLEEFGLRKNLRNIILGEKIDLSPFIIEPFRQTHSIPDSIGLAINTPVGLVVISGDFKFDQNPIDGKGADFKKLAEFGGRGVLALFCDSTNVEQPGMTPSESLVRNTFENIFSSVKSRIFLVTFASNFHRIQQAINMASKFGRKVAIAGKSLVNNIEVARKLGYLHIPDGLLVNIKEVNNLPAHKVLVLSTGSQGEAYSALSLLTNHSYKQLSLRPGDTVVLATTPVPGNEVVVYKLVDQLFKKGIEVIYGEAAGVHVSGHAAQEEIKLLINILKPKYLIPYHGEYRHLVLLKKLGVSLGIPEDNIKIIENGWILELDENSAKVKDKIDLNNIYIDGISVGDVGNIILRERKKLSEDGVVVVGVLVDSETGLILDGPNIISKGFVFLKESEELIESAKEKIRDFFKKNGKNNANKELIVKGILEDFFNQEIKRKPVIIPVVWEI
ncbi:MAG TPA: ribonuclease J [Dictyoglomaceae bacterium]|nr:ribonuclease J [Dictyoglomaceae bacterium]HOL40129.1 ribonuclease J [Dictyoglomaceae bacterium]HOP95424.1 ribonuclease J [Dictyoglomaceae bacterium]HPP15579.1 ribonuclease J [Dictyoglomaceae bacterium]HPU42894.1 ribonuclease J [Dictyoglomaceae bacterium]